MYVRLSYTVYIDPSYPQPEQLKLTLLNTTSIALTWNHPDTSSLFEVNDEYFNYSITVVMVSTGVQLMQYNTSITYNDTPWVLIDYGLFLLNNCEEIEFSVGLVGDCRTLMYTAFLPICKLKCNNQ